MGLYDRDYMQDKEPPGGRGPSVWTALLILLVLGGILAVYILKGR